MKNNIVITILIAVIFGAIGFFTGIKYQQNRRPTFNSQFGGGQGMMRGSRTAGSRQTIGEIISQDDKSITVKLQDGSTKIVLLSSKTNINEAKIATKADLKIGEKVAVFGIENTDGSVTAQNIQLNPKQFKL